ncbi:type IV pilin biogenesis protein, putative [Plesiocystis pacifica SIR-1]|uniref:Type IV pilin biogenesis protein, putative n=1 Tax=Plesiocystis pacifica SIR-1 TaxID=391625 RepID=A6GFI8_9BACT|nr:type IV pilin biogenesis protein, putative [Plesiocystis pacifica SIR-1]
MRLLGLAILALGLLARPGETEAKLDPFYIVHGKSFGQVPPRVLFVLDNSGSMAMDDTYLPNATYPNTKCWWDNCENENAGFLQSRIHAARKVIQLLIEDNAGAAEFGLMTFGTALPPTKASEVPDPCVDEDTDEDKRFTWIENVNQPYSTQWKPASNAFGGQGFWLLCGDNRPFPYLRHDDLGGFSMPNDSDAELPDQPLYVTESNLGAYMDPANYTRKVQFFPRFLGRRANLNCSDPNQEAIALGSFGDWGNNDGDKQAEVCGHDFYYWPYVDGNPGYSFYDGQSVDDFEHQECDDNGNCKDEDDGIHRLGVTRRDQWVGASLYAPFYSDEVINNPAIDAADKGPLTEADANVMLMGAVDEMYAGGADVTGGTPMAVAMGVTEYLIKTDNQGKITGPKPALTMSNAPFAHPTIASYLAFMRVHDQSAMCAPLSMIVVTDGQPDPWWKQGGAKLYERMRSIRRILGVKTYFVAFSDGVASDPLKFERVHEMACAASGADSIPTPCDGGNELFNWDTCRNPEDPANDCAYLASDHEELETVLAGIINTILDTDIPGGTPTVASDFQLADPNDPNSNNVAAQTTIESWTESESWAGHVARQGCTDEDPDNPGQLADYCENVATLPLDTLEQETYGPCALGRVWDAGVCLEQTTWSERKLYTHGFANEKIKIMDAGSVTPEFEALIMALNDDGKIEPALTSGDESVEIQAMAEYLHGKDMVGDWKLPALANSAPVLIRRVAQQDSNFLPSVGIADPHCAGRRNAQGDDVPSSLKAFSAQAWELAGGGSDYYEYTEAVLVGDDFGILHAFHYNSGNEIFGFVPMELLNNARVLSVNGVENFGQPDALDEHVFGLAATVNTAIIYDETASKWRHAAVFGLGPGGSQIVAMDVSHMGRPDDPFEILWTTSTASIHEDYEDTLGETWSRPAVTYAVPNDEMSVEPKAYLVFGSGYREGAGEDERGRTMWMVDAATGETLVSKALIPLPAEGTTYDALDDVTAVTDIAVGSHCLSRYWGEMQEAYITDPAGRLFRWDVGAESTNVSSFPHAADSGGTWPVNNEGFAVATEAFRFPACQGTSDFSCSIAAIGPNGNKGDVFTFPPAVAANNRIDDIDDPGTLLPMSDRDQFLIAMVSGSPNDDSIDGGDGSNDFHSSLYLLADDHRADGAAGFAIPNNGVTTLPGASPSFMRLPLSTIERTRTIVYPNGDEETETRVFSKAARPLRAPMIRVTGVLDGDEQLDVEVYYVTYTIYEPGEASCDERWYDEDNDEWLRDPGATYEITFRLVVEGDNSFDFTSGYALPSDYGDGFGASAALSAAVVEQVLCEGDNCGPKLNAPSTSPCDPNVDPPAIGAVQSVKTGMGMLDGFSPLEIPL